MIAYYFKVPFMQKKLPKLQKVKTVAYFHYLIKLQKHNCKDIDALYVTFHI